MMREAFYGTRRFDAFARRTGLTAPVLAARLRDLVAADLLQQVAYREPGSRSRQEYHLTARGRDLAVAVVALLEWADRWVPGPAGATVLVEHTGCGAAVHAELACLAGHRGLPPMNVAPVPGPGARQITAN